MSSNLAQKKSILFSNFRLWFVMYCFWLNKLMYALHYWYSVVWDIGRNFQYVIAKKRVWATFIIPFWQYKQDNKRNLLTSPLSLSASLFLYRSLFQLKTNEKSFFVALPSFSIGKESIVERWKRDREFCWKVREREYDIKRERERLC